MDGSKRAIVIDVKSVDHTDPGFPVYHMASNVLKHTYDIWFIVIVSAAAAHNPFSTSA
jgi:hypothetical protein